MIERALESLDHPRLEVAVDAMVAEVTLTDNDLNELLQPLGLSLPVAGRVSADVRFGLPLNLLRSAYRSAPNAIGEGHDFLAVAAGGPPQSPGSSETRSTNGRSAYGRQ